MSKASKSNSKILSTWTPLNNEEANRKVFEERRELVGKWFDKWSDSQRKKIINDILKMSRTSQLEFMESVAKTKIPVRNADFTRMYPRVITLYIFSFLDPRTLCRCAQVCWFWKYLCELDQLWMMKCLRLGWNLSFTPGPFEQGLWKRNYIENIKSLQYLKPEVALPPRALMDLDLDSLNSTARSSRKTNRSGLDILRTGGNRRSPPKPIGSSKPAWKGSDPTPKDTYRYNYLNNDDEVEIIKALRRHGLSGSKSSMISSKAKSKVKTGRHSLNTRSQSMTQSPPPSSRSTFSRISENSQGLSGTDQHEPTVEENLYGGRPSWAQPAESNGQQSFAPTVYPTHKESFQSRLSVRSEREPPVSGAFEAFTQKPWNIPDQTDSD